MTQPVYSHTCEFGRRRAVRAFARTRSEASCDGRAPPPVPTMRRSSVNSNATPQSNVPCQTRNRRCTQTTRALQDIVAHKSAIGAPSFKSAKCKLMQPVYSHTCERRSLRPGGLGAITSSNARASRQRCTQIRHRSAIGAAHKQHARLKATLHTNPSSERRRSNRQNAG